MSKYVSFLALLLLLSWSSSCSTSNGCRGGGWYGDRNLSEVTPVLPDQQIITNNLANCEP